MGQIIKTNGERIDCKPKNGTDYKLAELQKIVGGFIDVVTLGDGLVMVVDENGLQDKEPNLEATIVAKAYGAAKYIVGDVLICKSEEVK